MSIIYKNNIFFLSGKSYTYAMYVNGTGYLQHSYYGKSVNTSDIEFYVTHIGCAYEPKKGDINADMSFDTMPQEYGCFAHGDYREPSVIAERTDGSAMSRFSYVSYKIYDGVPKIDNMPHARTGGQTLAIKLKDDFSDTEVILNYTVYDDSNVLIRNAEITNTGKASVQLKKAFSFCMDLPQSNYKLMRLCGAWAAERSPVISPIEYGITKIQSLRGCSSHQINPFAAILKTDCKEDSGECYGIQLVYSGSFSITAESVYNGSLRIQGGINDTNFGWCLNENESFITPQAALCYSDNGLGGLSREYADFLRQYIINPIFVNKSRPIVVNNWEATYFDFDNEKLFAIIDEAAQLGIDTFVLDDGWFGTRNSDNGALGDWFVNDKKLEGGLKSVIDRCKQHNLKFGLWFEPEAISENSDLYRSHPDWAIGKDSVEPARWRNQLVLDFTRKEVADYIYAEISKILKLHEISYVKWDFNRSISEFYSRSLGKNQGEFAHRYILGVYDLAQRLTSSFPYIFFEGCAGGGARFDAGMLYYFPQIWTSDNTDAYERAKIQWGTSMCYPVSAMSCHVSACPNHQTGRTTPFETRGTIASLGATGYELDLSKISQTEKNLIREQIESYKQIEKILLNGDLYRLSDPFDSNYFCEMIVSKDKRAAYAAGMRIHGVPNDFVRIMRLNGLDENKTYHVQQLNITASGRALINIGLKIPSLVDYESWQWNIIET